MRVVGNADAPQRRRGDKVTINAVAETVATSSAGAAAPAALPARLPLVPALLFLLACIGGGVAVALFAPFGNG